jgi:DNA-binding transcriptional ArsR family regulator
MKGPSVDVFQALADPTRRSILQALGKKESSIRGIAEAFPQSRNAIVKHLAVLKAAALVEAIPQGRETVHRLMPGPLDDVKKWLAYFDAFWDDKLTRLKQAAEGPVVELIPKKAAPRRPGIESRGTRKRGF